MPPVHGAGWGASPSIAPLYEKPVFFQAAIDLVQRARAGGLRSSEITDPSITVTSLGPLGGITHPAISWQNRPTYQQVVSFTGHRP